jgi:glucose-6-phosphate-specific signal transduction histidine kinase
MRERVMLLSGNIKMTSMAKNGVMMSMPKKNTNERKNNINHVPK